MQPLHPNVTRKNVYIKTYSTSLCNEVHLINPRHLSNWDEIAYCKCRGGRGEGMDTSTRERDIVKQVIQRYAQFKPSHGDIRLDTVFDDTQNRYALMQVGWDRGRRVRGNLIYVTLSEGKVWVEYDGMEQGITKDLIAAGIPPERIVLAFLPEEQTAATA